MKTKFVFIAALALFVMAISASAQKAPADFTGKWNLDLAKSKLTDREKASIEAQTITVTQTPADIKIETETKRIAPAGGAPAGGGGGGGRAGGGGMGGPQVFLLGKETTADQTMGQNTVPVTSGSKWDGSKLVTSRSFTFNGPNGEIKSSTKQTFDMGADGKSLTVTVDSTGAQGTTTSVRVYAKQ
jgi:hypothetical protein